MFESTRVAKIDPVSFKFIGSRLINGLIPDAFVSRIMPAVNLRVMTVAGGGVAKKMNWLVTGQTSTDTSDQAVDNVYVIDGDLKAVYSAERLNIGGGVWRGALCFGYRLRFVVFGRAALCDKPCRGRECGIGVCAGGWNR